METIDEFFRYVNAVGILKLIRIFWFFFFFELIRYVFVEVFAVLSWWVRKRNSKEYFDDALHRLYLEEPLVSIVVPGKNEGKHIYKLARSLREQTYQNFELIIIDDGSDDDTYMICNSLKKNGYIDMFLSNKFRGGKASAANLGLRFSKGKYIVHLDADCSYDRDAIEQVILPFYLDDRIGGVGGNVLVRNYDESLATTLQAIEYTDTISVGRIATSRLGIYRVISGAFGAFRKDIMDRINGWDIGPGLDGDITVKIRKLGYKIHFAPEAVCMTSVPNTFRKLTKQRLRWDKSLIRFRLRKHFDVFFPTQSFRFSNFISFLENIVYNLFLNFKWYFYIIDILMNFLSQITFVLFMNLFLYTSSNTFRFLFFAMFRKRKNAPVKYFLLYMPLMVVYFGYYLRIVRTIAYISEMVFKASYKDPWNPQKSSSHAKRLGL